MSKLPYFKFYYQDFYFGTLDLTHEQRGIYILMLCYCWDKEKLPTDIEQLKRIFNTTETQLNALLQKFIKKDDGYYNERLDAERLFYINKCEKNKENIKKRYERITNVLPSQKSEVRSQNIELRSHDSEVSNVLDTKISNTHTKKFTKPTVEEIKRYCNERNNKVNPSRFFDFYESKGWLVGKNKMKDWKAAVRNWEQLEKAETGSTLQDLTNVEGLR